ncbi:histone-lysine N-methyltransferase SETD2 isoform X2 [Dendrobates tinctorius]|uniref:histone-lysine N-methyltransferase SETD2 isoform X2 n=1 Tax=Dendrobates tinctorius TaxID=92724 RepID=UPI003CC9D1DE
MGDFYDPEHPTEEEDDNEAKSDGSSKGFGKSAGAFKGISSSRFLPKGTKSKVNLEEQGRQKVSFSFSFTKKTFQNRLLTPLVSDKQNEPQSNPLALGSAEQISKLKMDFVESTGGVMEVSPPKPKVELGKIHFKKHLLSVTSKLPAPQSPPPPPPPPPPIISAPISHSHSPQEAQIERMKSSPDVEVVPFPANTSFTKSPLKEHTSSASSKERLSPSPSSSRTGTKESREWSLISVVEIPSTQMVVDKVETTAIKEYSHIGKEEKSYTSVQSVKSNPSPEKPRSKSSHSETIVVGSESDEDSVQTSSSHRSHELKHASSKERDSKRCSMSLRSEDSGKYTSSRSRSGKDQKHSGYSRSDRDSKYSSSYSHCRSDRERRRSKSRSRSRSRSRSDRGPRSSLSFSRSERSHHYESERRYHRSSPYRTRYSRSYADSRARDSSDSEDDYRRSYSRPSDSRHPPSSSHSYRETRMISSSHSKYDKDLKFDSSHYSDRRGTTTSSRTGKDSKSPAGESSRRGSPPKEANIKHGSSHWRVENLKSIFPKSSDSKSDSVTSGRKISKWDLEERPVPKDERKTVKKDESSPLNIPVHKKAASPLFYRHKVTSTIENKMVTSFDPNLEDTEQFIDDQQSNSSPRTNDDLPHGRGWHFVTLSSTENFHSEDPNETPDSENCNSDVPEMSFDSSETEQLDKSDEDLGAHALSRLYAVSEDGEKIPPSEAHRCYVTVHEDSMSPSESKNHLESITKDSRPCHDSNETDCKTPDPGDEFCHSTGREQIGDNHTSVIHLQPEPRITNLILQKSSLAMSFFAERDLPSETTAPKICYLQSTHSEAPAEETPEKNKTSDKNDCVPNEVTVGEVLPSSPQVCKSKNSLAIKNSSTGNVEENEKSSASLEIAAEWIEVHVENEFSKQELDTCEVLHTEAVEETINDGSQLPSDSMVPSMNFISAVQAYYSDSEERESANSESEDTDSDDSGLPRNRLQSVVVVPKTSILTMEESIMSPVAPEEGQQFTLLMEEGQTSITIKDGEMSSMSVEVAEPSAINADDANLAEFSMNSAKIPAVTMEKLSIFTIESMNPAAVTMEDAGPAAVTLEGAGRAAVTLEGAGRAAVTMEGAGRAAVTMEGAGQAAVTMEGAGPAAVTMEGAGPAVVTLGGSKLAAVTKEGARPTAVTTEGARPTAVTMESARPAAVIIEDAKPAAITKESARPTAVSIEAAITKESVGPEAVTMEGLRPTAVTIERSRPTSVTMEDAGLAVLSVKGARPTALAVEGKKLTSLIIEGEGLAAVTIESVRPATVTMEGSIPTAVIVDDATPAVVTMDSVTPAVVTMEGARPTLISTEEEKPLALIMDEVKSLLRIMDIKPSALSAKEAQTSSSFREGADLSPITMEEPKIHILSIETIQNDHNLQESRSEHFKERNSVHIPIPSTPAILEDNRKNVPVPKTENQHPSSDSNVSTSRPVPIKPKNKGKALIEGNAAQESQMLGPAKPKEPEKPATPAAPSIHPTVEKQLVASFVERPDSRHQGPGYNRAPGHGDYSRVDGFQAAEDLSDLGWDFSQPEKPSSTYQPPDSSYMYFCYQQGSSGHDPSHNYVGDNGYWNSSYPSKHDDKYSKPSGQLPDSVTHCYNEDDDDEEYDYSWNKDHMHEIGHHPKAFPNKSRESSSVQAHEISSNSIKDHGPRTDKRETLARERSDMKERGPPKKRRQELESDLENDAEALERRKMKAEAGLVDSPASKHGHTGPICCMEDFRDPQHWKDCYKLGKMPTYFDLIEENVYLTERKKNKSHRDIKRMQCECPLLSKEERSQGEVACGEDCLNRLLMIECSSRCPNGDYCSNRRFQRKQHADVECILTDKKGWGLRAGRDLKPNTFVLEYCGEVLDHKEFKGRVKEYARSKNIHYYFMALKNDEIIDATQKGNCSRFMNHSCDPNCETQKWTVNGQLRVGFFTTRLVPAGAELTFDYQFQRYGKEAQKCFCGSANCRGYLGGENRVSVRAAGGKMKKERSRKKDSVDGELEALLENGEGLSDKNQVLSLSRLMVRIETLEQKQTCLKLIRNTQSQSCLKFFLECHGLSLLWIWMAELGDNQGNTSSSIRLQLEIIKTLELLPIPNKNMLEESKILPIIQRWAQTKMAIPQLSEGDGYSSENTSRAHTPLNTPANTPDPAAKLSVEIEGETPKKLILRRLKIISENSMDSAMSDPAIELEVKETPAKPETHAAEEQKNGHQHKVDVKAEDVPPSEEPPPPPIKADDESTAGIETCETETKETTKAEETPSQDEEEGVSDVESERSQEPTDKMLDMSELAHKLLDGWKDLKEVYRIPKKTQVEKENNDRWRDPSSVGYQTPTSKIPSRERDSDRQSQKKRKKSPSPPSFYERSAKRGEDRYDTPASSKKKGRLQDRNKLSTEERRKLFEQEVAQREAQKQQQQMQSIGITSPLPYDSMAYGGQIPPPFVTYPQGYPIQSYVDPTNPNMGKILLPTPPPLEGVTSPNSYDPSQAVVNPAMITPQPVTVVQHVPDPIDVPAQQYVAQPEPMVPQDASVTVMPVPAPSSIPVQTYSVWDPNQQAVAVPQHQTQPQYPAAPAQPAIYYPGQACPTVYGVPAAYTQTAQPMVQGYTQPGLQYMPGQQIYAPHPQGVVIQPAPPVAAIVPPGQPPAMQQSEMGMAPPNGIMDLPPPSPPKPKTIVLPPSWKTARDPEGKIYYYHVITRQTQWDPPTWDSPGEEGLGMDHEAEMDLGTPTYDENPMKSSKKAKTAEADTSSELAKRSKEVFRKEMSQFIVQCLNPYRKPDCKIGRINTTEDFKHLARKLTHGVMNKELKYCKNPEDLDCNENVKHKTKEYIKKYMQKFGSIYKPKEDVDFE